MLKDTAWNIFSNTGCIHCYMLYKEASQLNSSEKIIDSNTIELPGSRALSEGMSAEEPIM